MYVQKSSTVKTKANYSGSRRRVKLLMFGLLCFVAWAGYTFWQQSSHLNETEKNLNVLLAQKLEAENLNEFYQLEITRLHDQEYIEQMARRDYYMTRPGDTPLITPRIQQ